jgi:SAM-dependent methyltransferase
MGVAANTTILAKGLLSWVPGVQSRFYDLHAAHGTGSPAYCYGVWIKHFTMLAANGIGAVPASVVELGPGESIGTGVAALLCGAERYTAIDAVPHMRPEANVAVFHELVRLLRSRAPRSRGGIPVLDPYLDERGFPSSALPEEVLARALEPQRLRRIEHAVRSLGRTDPDAMIRYCTWSAPQPVPPGTVDLVMSHVVLQHIDDLAPVLANCARWLRPGGWMSHQVDCTSLGTAAEWNGHRAYGELTWRMIRGRRPYFVNRQPLSDYLSMLDTAGFEVLDVQRGRGLGGITRSQLAPRFRAISDDDFTTQSGFIVARRRGA